MTRTDKARLVSKQKQQKSKQKIIETVTGLFKEQYKKKDGSWNINKLAEHTDLTRQTVSKHLRVWEANQGSLFEEELGTIEGLPDE